MKIHLNFVERREADVKRRLIRQQTFDKLAKENIKNLLEAIELSSLVNKDIDFKLIITELDELIANYNAKFRSRSTRNLNKAIKKSNAPTTNSDAVDFIDNELV